MQVETTMVRDFIYVDVERLYSLYSQVFEGVADQIVQSYVDGLWSKDSQRGPIFQGVSFEARVAEVSRRTESGFLYDHMYNRLEARMSEAILEPSGISPDNFREVLSQAFMVRATGAAEIEDYDRINVFLEKFNSLGEAIAYAHIASDEFKASLRELEDSVTATRDRNIKARAKQQLKRLKDPKKIAEEMGLSQDEALLSNLRLFVEMFHSGALEITIIPTQGVEGVVFRGILDRRWLRVQPQLLRALYGGFVESNWTMVGQLTYLPGVEIPKAEQELDTRASEEVEEEREPAMRDAFRNMFITSLAFERMFLESQDRVEVIVCPLAIYREMAIPYSIPPAEKP